VALWGIGSPEKGIDILSINRDEIFHDFKGKRPKAKGQKVKRLKGKTKKDNFKNS
jgi:hypothetical protein